jgi:hypothetical protein
MKDSENPAHIYRDITKKITAKLRENLAATLDAGKSPDLYWKLEHAIMEAMKFADALGVSRTMARLESIIADFDNNDTPPSQ